ncbi:DUF2334 domain-containing protein [Peribacillus asahii]|uniref:DUF2334 domain-containing protein n=1 Tax=Peribacillus asahii TaxID=228899 RepID=UPI0038181B07
MQKLKWRIILYSLISCLAFFGFGQERLTNAKDIAQPSVLVIYSTESGTMTKEIYDLATWLSHFTTKVVFQSDYEVSDADFKNVTHLVYMGQVERNLPAKVVGLIDRFQGKTLAIGYNVEQLERYSFIKLTDDSTNINAVSFSKRNGYTLLQKSLPIQPFSDSNGSHLILEGYRGTDEVVPLAVRKKELYYIGVIEMDEQLHSFLVEVLHNFFKAPHPNKKDMIIILEGIDPTMQAKDIHKLTEVLERKDIPYLLVVSPFYEDKVLNKMVHLKDNKPLVEALHDSQGHGGYIIVKVQKDWELFERKVQELVYLGLYPIGGYGNEVSGLNRSDMVWVDDFVTTAPLQKINDGMGIQIPLFEQFTNPKSSVFNSLYFSKKVNGLADVSDRFLCLSFPSYLSKKELTSVIQSLEEVDNGQWFDLQEVKAEVQVPHVLIQLREGHLSVKEDIPFLLNYRNTLSLSKIEIVLWVVALVVVITIISFIQYIFWMRVNLRKRLFNERKVKENG